MADDVGNMVEIKEISSSVIEIRIPSYWNMLGKPAVCRYASNIASAYSLGDSWTATSILHRDDEFVTVKLQRHIG